MPRRGEPAVPGAWTPPSRDSWERTSLDGSPPRTPPPPAERFNSSKGFAHPLMPRTAVAAGPGHDARDEHDAEDPRGAPSDPHDLSWSPQRQRRSVLENMLLSLDQAAGNEPLVHGPPAGRPAAAAIAAAAGDDASQPAHAYAFSTPPRHRSNTGNSSISYYSPAVETQSPDHTHVHTRGHRSNSSLTFQPGLGRIDSLRNARGPQDPSAFGAGDPLAVTPRASASRRPTRGSAGSSVDFGHSADGRWQANPKRRSRSFDQGLMGSDPFAALDRRAFHFASAEDQATATAIYDSLEAAPMPTIPGGPRRYGEPVPISPIPDSGEAPRSSRRGSLRGPIGIFTRSERSQSPKRGEMRGERVERPSNLRHGSSYEDSTQTPHSIDLPDHARTPFGTSSASTPGSGSQRQGFFRRVFGAGKANATAIEPALPSPSRTMSESATTTVHQLEKMMHGPIPDQGTSLVKDPRKARKGEKEKEMPPLNKKPSFFRRRKKSMAAANAVSDLPPQLHPDLPTNRVIADARPRTASPSSLWNVLDPYLANSQPQDPDAGNRSSYEEASHERMARNSVGRATIRPIQRGDQGDLVVSNSPRYKDSGPRDSISQETPQPSKARNNRPKDLSINVESRDVDGQGASGTRMGHKRQVSDVDKALPTTPTTAAKEKSAAFTKDPPRSARSKAKTMPTEVTGSDKIEQEARTPYQTTNGTPTQSQQLWVVPDKTKPAPTQPPPPPPTSPDAGEPAIAHFPRLSIDEGSDYNTADSKPTSPTQVRAVASQDTSKMKSVENSNEPIDEPSDEPHDEPIDEPIDEFVPTNEDHEYAQKLFHGKDGIDRGEAAAWLGGEGVDRTRVRKAYMQLFDWTNTSILGAMRGFCSQTRLKGETQQVDRVLDALSTRWCECNPQHGFKATDVVHTICYSILLLNTDLHMANIDSKMSRSQFIKNTMPTIRRVVADAAPLAFQESHASLQPPTRPPPAIPTEGAVTDLLKVANLQRPSLTHRPSFQSDSENANSGPATPVEGTDPSEGCGPLVTTPFAGKQAAWELHVEVVLKNFYISIRQERLFLYGSDNPRAPARSQPSSNSLSAIGGTQLRRSNSMVSKAGSESYAMKGRLHDGRPSLGSRWSSKIRSRTQLYPPSSSHAQSSRTSFDDDAASAISPSATSMWSRVSFGKTQGSMSVNSFSMFPAADFHKSIGFANALSQAIIREEATGDGEDSLRVRPLLEDESLELAGAPWAKEGILKHKHHLESVDKKSRDRSWVECFAVIEKGWMRLFQFNVNARSLRQKARGKPQAGAVVGGGNWTENAESLGSYLLRQSIATALPPPGYSKTRPHVWALSLPNGAVHLFQVGTPEIVKEFVSTANYWSARTSKEPLVGGVSNTEYGWSDAVINMALLNQEDPSRPSGLGGPRPSIQGSIRGSIDQSNSARPRLPADRINITDWSPPMQSTMPSQLMEVDQLRALEAYVGNIELELQRHNELHRPMQLAYTPRTANYVRAMSNWERKSSYLLQEIVKFTTYIESLRAAQGQQAKIFAEREEREKEKDREAEERGMAELEGSTA